MDPNLTEQVFNNPYILTQIVRRLDIRSVTQCHSISKDFFSAAVFESDRRKDIIHLYLLNYNQSIGFHYRDVPNLFESFTHFTRLWLNMRPKSVILMVGGYRQNQIDYRHKVVEKLIEFLPNDCRAVYLDVGHTVLTSSIRFKSLTNYSDERRETHAFHRTAFPCMSCLLIPDIDGVQVKIYTRIENVDIKDVKCVLLFMSSKKLIRKTRFETREEIQRTKREISILLARLDYDVSFGGGTVVAAITSNKNPFKECVLREHLFITFSGDGIRTASSVITTSSDEEFLPQLLKLREGLDFDCDDWSNAITIGYVFANHDNFSQEFTSAFQTVFPCVGIFGFQTNNRMYGKHFSTNDSSGLNRFYEDINPLRDSVIVLVNIEIKRH